MSNEEQIQLLHANSINSENMCDNSKNHMMFGEYEITDIHNDAVQESDHKKSKNGLFCCCRGTTDNDVSISKNAGIQGLFDREYDNTCVPDSSCESRIQDETIKCIKKKKQRKSVIKHEDIEITKFDDYYKVLYKGVRITKLKEACKLFGLKVSGNKNQLVKRLYDYLYQSSKVVNIQSCLRREIAKRWYNSHGEGAMDKKLCVNSCDFVTLEELDDLHIDSFFSFRCVDGYVYGQDICSIGGLIKRAREALEEDIKEGIRKADDPLVVLNPYTRRTIDTSVITQLDVCKRLSKVLKRQTDLDMKNPEADGLSGRTVDLFSIIDSYGHYTNVDWLLDLDQQGLRNFMGQLNDIFEYRAGLSQAKKIQIVPPKGRLIAEPLRTSVWMKLTTRDKLLEMCTELIERLVVKPPCLEHRNIGAYYVLTALTLVSPSAATAMPWLYESVLPA